MDFSKKYIHKKDLRNDTYDFEESSMKKIKKHLKFFKCFLFYFFIFVRC